MTYPQYGKVRFLYSQFRAMSSNLFIYKYFTRKSLFLKDLATESAKSLIPKDRAQGGLDLSRATAP